jgi:hypothetical protein
MRCRHLQIALRGGRPTAVRPWSPFRGGAAGLAPRGGSRPSPFRVPLRALKQQCRGAIADCRVVDCDTEVETASAKRRNHKKLHQLRRKRARAGPRVKPPETAQPVACRRVCVVPGIALLSLPPAIAVTRIKDAESTRSTAVAAGHARRRTRDARSGSPSRRGGGGAAPWQGVTGSARLGAALAEFGELVARRRAHVEHIATDAVAIDEPGRSKNTQVL